jgi:addiction module HigA family antidote
MTLLIPEKRRPITPGEVLREDFIEPLGLTQGAVASALDVDRTTVNELLNNKRNVTPEMAFRLAYVFGTTPIYWMHLQLAVDLFDTLHSKVAEEAGKHLKVLAGCQSAKS